MPACAAQNEDAKPTISKMSSCNVQPQDSVLPENVTKMKLEKINLPVKVLLKPIDLKPYDNAALLRPSMVLRQISLQLPYGHLPT